MLDLISLGRGQGIQNSEVDFARTCAEWVHRFNFGYACGVSYSIYHVWKYLFVNPKLRWFKRACTEKKIGALPP
jgi:hypothetical protein